MKERSEDLWLVAYFLSKYGSNSSGKLTLPPKELKTKSWGIAYKKFYDRLGTGQALLSFTNSLKNCRDAFDSHIGDSGRQGWKDANNLPAKLPEAAQLVLDRITSVSRGELWQRISQWLPMETAEGEDVKLSTSKSVQDKETESKTNPDWTREELIIALNLYFDLDQGQMHKNNHEVIRVSDELRSLAIHKNIPDWAKFRNPSGVARRLGNFKTMDSRYGGEGLTNSGKLAKEVFKEFSSHRDKLRREAEIIRDLYIERRDLIKEPKAEYNTPYAFSLHKSKESDILVVKRIKRQELVKGNQLSCKVCGFNAIEYYGEIANDCMEVHCDKFIKGDDEYDLVRDSDFIIVCSNCHQVLDKNYGIIDATDLRNILQKK